MSSAFTMAQNFTSSVDRDIDPRTGQFKPVISLGEIKGNSGAGPHMPITLVYSPSSSINQGLGIGWSISVASFDFVNRVLNHPNGSNWALKDGRSGDGYYDLKHQKVKDFRFKDAGDGTYCIWNSSGDAVIIGAEKYIIGNTRYQLATTMFNAAGDQISFKFDQSGRITSIIDGDGQTTLLKCIYGGSTATITLFPGTDFSKTFNFDIPYSYLTQISCDTKEKGTIYWKLESGTNKENATNVTFNGNNALLSIEYPSGIKNSVIYNVGDDGFRSPDGVTIIPSIRSSVTNHGGGQPPIRKKYSYGPSYQNYLGYGSGLSYTSTNDDELYKSNAHDYQYYVIETVLDENQLEAFSTTYTYNKYHLLDTEVFLDSKNKAKRTTLNNYDESIYTQQDPDSLPVWFQNPVTVTVITETNLDSEPQTKKLIRSYEYYGSDNQYCEGLIKSQTFANQKKVSYEYYKANGSEPGCDKNPYVIANGSPSNYHKSITVTDISGTETELLRLEFEYKSLKKKLNAKQNFPSESYLAQSQIRLFTAGQYVVQKIYNYDEDNGSISYGNIKGIYINSVNQNGNQNSNNREFIPVNSVQYNYKVTDINDTEHPNCIVKNTTLSGLYNTTDTDYICKYRGIKLESQNLYGNKSRYKYGTTNVLLEESYLTNDPFYQTITNHTYGSEIDGVDYFNTLVTELTIPNPGNNLNGFIHSGQRQWLDGADRPIKLAQALGSADSNNQDLNYKKISENTFNYFGESQKITSHDNLPSIDGGELLAAEAVKNNIYDAFRKLSGYEFPNLNTESHIVESIFNPANISTKYIDNCIKETRRKEVSIENSNITDTVFASNGSDILHNSVHQFSIYGPISSISESITGQTDSEPNSYEYKFTSDSLGRPISKTYGDGSIMKLEYDSRFYKPLITKIILLADKDSSPKTILECAYNERGLIVKKSLTGRDLSYGFYHSYEYDSKYPRLVSKTQPDRTTTFYFTYNDYLAGKISSIKTSNNIEKKFFYNNVGQLISVTETNNGTLSFATDREVDALGRVTSESYKTNQATESSKIQVSYSDGNSKVLSFTDTNGIQTSNYYNKAMQLVRTENSIMRAEFTYDAAARLIQKNTWSMKQGSLNESSKITSEYAYDENDGNLKTIYERSGGALRCTIAMTYRSDGLLKSRTYMPGNSTQSNRTEKFVYDNRKRLSKYTCDGSSVIKDSNSNSIVSQKYQYDSYNNIISITSMCRSGNTIFPSVISYKYEDSNPFLLTSIQKDNSPEIKITNDLKFDRALNDDQGRVFEYDTFERISKVTQKSVETVFQYDALDAMRIQTTGKERRYLCYDGNSIASEYTKSGVAIKNKISRIYSEHGYLGQTDNVGQNFVAVPVDGLDTPIFTDATSFELSSGTAPFGDSDQVSKLIPSYRGEVYNDALGGYFLGNGYRVYNPRLGRFSSPDSLDPHTKAGINPFGYAHNDPINYADPNGHLPQPAAKGSHWGSYLAFVGAIVIGVGLMVGVGAMSGGLDMAFVRAALPQMVLFGASFVAETAGQFTGDSHPADTRIAHQIADAALIFGFFTTATDWIKESKEASKLLRAGKDVKTEVAETKLEGSLANSEASGQTTSMANARMSSEEHQAQDERRNVRKPSTRSAAAGARNSRVLSGPPSTELIDTATQTIDDFTGTQSPVGTSHSGINNTMHNAGGSPVTSLSSVNEEMKGPQSSPPKAPPAPAFPGSFDNPKVKPEVKPEVKPKSGTGHQGTLYVASQQEIIDQIYNLKPPA